MSAENRYSCQVKLPGFGQDAQVKLEQAKVLIVGMGGLGCPAAQYLVSVGVGTLAILDFDTVSQTNLHRQILFTEEDVGLLKVKAAATTLRRQNPHIAIIPISEKITSENVLSLVEDYDIVLDCTDNFATKTVLNDGCVLADTPLVYGAAYQYEGQVAVWNVLNGDGTRSPHYRDLFPSVESQPGADCASGGIMPTLTGITGCMQATEAIKYLAELPGLLSSQMLILSTQTMQTQVITLPKTSWTPITDLPETMQEISASQLKEAQKTGEYYLIDVRTPAEHAEFDIGGELIPLPDLLAGKTTIDTSRPIIFYCATGNRSLTAVHYMKTKHPELTTVSLAGGLVAWE